MAQETQAPSQPVQPSHPAPNPVPPPIAKNQPTSSTIWIALLMFVLGVIGGILLHASYPKFTNKEKPIPTSPSNQLTLPLKPSATPTRQASPSADLMISPESSISATTEPSPQPTLN